MKIQNIILPSICRHQWQKCQSQSHICKLSYIFNSFFTLIIFYILFKLQMPDKKNLQSGFCLLFTYCKMQLLTSIIDTFLVWETYYSVFHIVFHNKELKLLLKSLIKFRWRNCDHYIISQRFFRSSLQRCSMKKGVLRNVSKFTVKHLCQSLFFNKVAGLGLQLY